MSRVIKFRAWNRTVGVMIADWCCIDHSGVEAPSAKRSDVVARGDDYEVMQCTGLKDKYGVEIYEGDIFKEDEDGTTDYVEWSDYFCGWATHTWWTPRDLKDSVGYYEVIGNIYENPELLKGGAA
jgi:uncharacterized phage protein (TIGR01671 family)